MKTTENMNALRECVDSFKKLSEVQKALRANDKPKLKNQRPFEKYRQ